MIFSRELLLAMNGSEDPDEALLNVSSSFYQQPSFESVSENLAAGKNWGKQQQSWVLEQCSKAAGEKTPDELVCSESSLCMSCRAKRVWLHFPTLWTCPVSVLTLELVFLLYNYSL